MRIALLGGNSYQYGFAPSYVHANGRGYITGNQLLGAEARTVEITPEQAADIAAELRSEGQPVPANIKALEDRYNTERRAGYFETGAGLLQQGIEFGKQIIGAKNKPAAEGTGSQATDNTALIITGVVAGVAVLGVILATSKKKRS